MHWKHTKQDAVCAIIGCEIKLSYIRFFKYAFYRDVFFVDESNYIFAPEVSMEVDGPIEICVIPGFRSLDEQNLQNPSAVSSCFNAIALI